jgi:hypothetical protein
MPDPRLVDELAAVHPQPRQTGILIFDGVEELDAAGPWEVLSTSRGRRRSPSRPARRCRPSRPALCSRVRPSSSWAPPAA